MKTVEDAMSDWIKRWDVNGWHKEEDDLSTELVVDYWNQDSEEEIHPPHSLRRAAKNRIIREAIEKNRVIDLDAIYKDGKLFGYTVIRVDDVKGAIVRVRAEESGHKYIVSFKFDWENFELRIEVHPSGQDAFMRFCHPLDSLFNLKDGLAEMAVKDSVHRIITEFEEKDNNNIW